MTHLALFSGDGARLVEYGIGIGAFALVAWIVRHVTTNTIPGLVKDFKEAIKEQSDAFERTNRENRQEFREILESDRQLHHQREEVLRAEFREVMQSSVCKAEAKE